MSAEQRAKMLDMEEMIRQIRAAEEAGLYYLGLFGALTLPDICGALASDDGTATRSRYKSWLRDNVPEYGRDARDADLIYGLRCSLLHQGSALPDRRLPVAFMHPPPGQGGLHNLSIVGNDGRQVAYYTVRNFVADITRGAEAWFRQYGTSASVKRNLEKFARIRPEGMPPDVVGCPVIA